LRFIPAVINVVKKINAKTEIIDFFILSEKIK